jgi:hypothetical protein
MATAKKKSNRVARSRPEKTELADAEEVEEEIGTEETDDGGAVRPVGGPVLGATGQQGGEQFISKPVALVVSILLVIGIIVLGYLFIQTMKGAVSKGGTPDYTYSGQDDQYYNTDQWDPSLLNTTGVPSDETCFAAYGLDPRTPIFAYRPTCPYCEEMSPIIRDLENRGYSFRWVDRTNTDENKMLYACLRGTVADVVPQLICPNTRKERQGVLTENEIIEFAENCTKS